jgi:hypothetical protein
MVKRKMQLNNLKTYHTIIIKAIYALLFFVLLFCSGEKKLSRDEANDCLKILNSDLVNLADNASEMAELKALRFLRNEKSAPLPFKNDSATNVFNRKEYYFEENTGVYCWNSNRRYFEKVRDTSVISLHFPSAGSLINNVHFLMSTYKTQKINSRPDFPIDVQATISIDDRELFNLIHEARIDENLPRSIHTITEGSNYKVEFDMDRLGKAADKTGIMNMKMVMSVPGKEIIHSEFTVGINYHNPTYSVKDIKVEQEFFGIQLKGTIDYEKINPTSNAYAEEVNRHSSLILRRKSDGAVIGRLVMGELPRKDQLDYFIRFSDNSEELLSNYILPLKKILNLKY